MARNPRHHLPPSKVDEKLYDDTPKSLSKQEFGRRLHAILLQRGWNQSELARKTGVGRDAISTYVRGRSFPEPGTLKKMADALNMDPAELLPNALESAVDRDLPALEIREAIGHPGMAWLRINQRVTTDQALRIMQILQERVSNGGFGDDDKTAPGDLAHAGGGSKGTKGIHTNAPSPEIPR